MWEQIAADRLAKYKASGLALRGARYREGISQKELAKRSAVSQEYISRMENGLRPIGEQVAKKLAKVLHIDPGLLSPSLDTYSRGVRGHRTLEKFFTPPLTPRERVQRLPIIIHVFRKMFFGLDPMTEFLQNTRFCIAFRTLQKAKRRDLMEGITHHCS